MAEKINKRNGETLYPGERIKTFTVGLADSQEAHIQRTCAKNNMRLPGSGWTRSKYIQALVDADIKKAQRQEEGKK